MPEVSILIPTRNRRRFLARTLASALDQRVVDLEVVVVDDCSSDGTPAILGGFRDRRLRVTRQLQRSGVSAARNRGIDESTGEWVAFLDDDDLWAPDKLLKQLRAAQGLSRGWVYGGWAMVTPDLTVMSVAEPPSPEVVCRFMPLRNMIPTGASNVLVHRRLLDQAGRFDPQLRHLADWDMWIRLAQLGVPSAVPDPVLAYVLHPSNASADSDDAPREMMIVEQRYRGVRTQPTVDRAAIYRWMAWHHLRGGRRLKALQAYARAVGCGDALSIGRAAVGVVWPGAAWRVRASERDARWQEVASWLSDLQTEPTRGEVASL